MITISNQFANKQNQKLTTECINDVYKICGEKFAERIAVNIDYDNLRHYIFFKEYFEEVFKNSEISITFYLNKIIELLEREDIDFILKLYHNNKLSGHIARDKMMKTISKFYSWNKMEKDIAEYVRRCPVCEKTKTIKNTKIPMMISEPGTEAFENCYIDFVGPVAESNAGNKYILTLCCDVTRFLIAVPTKDSTAITVANNILEHVICRYNFPRRLISDNAQCFLSKIIKELTHLFAIKKIFTTPYMAQGNQIERFHRFLNSYIRGYVETNKSEWDTLLKFATFAYNNTIQTSTGYTPHELLFGFKI